MHKALVFLYVYNSTLSSRPPYQAQANMSHSSSVHFDVKFASKCEVHICLLKLYIFSEKFTFYSWKDMIDSP